MGNLSLSGRPKASEQDKAVLSLKVQRDKLKQYQKKMEKVIDLETDRLKANIKESQAAGINDVQKERLRLKSLFMMKKIKMQKIMLEKSDNHLLNLQQMLETIEFKLVEVKVMDGLKQGSKMLETLNKSLQTGLSEIQNIQEDAMDGLDEVDAAFRELAGDQHISDEDLLEELDKLQQSEQQSEELGKIDVKLPDVPTHAPSVNNEANTVQEKKIKVIAE